MITAFDVTIFWHSQKEKVLFRTNQEYTFFIDGKSIVVPEGFETDFASVPKTFWGLFPPIGKHNPAALVHDYLYDNRIGTRRNADMIFLRLMLQYGVDPFRSLLMYGAVRIFGKRWWRR
jgi:hypothetical protein